MISPSGGDHDRAPPLPGSDGSSIGVSMASARVSVKASASLVVAGRSGLSGGGGNDMPFGMNRMPALVSREVIWANTCRVSHSISPRIGSSERNGESASIRRRRVRGPDPDHHVGLGQGHRGQPVAVVDLPRGPGDHHLHHRDDLPDVADLGAAADQVALPGDGQVDAERVQHLGLAVLRR